MNYQLVVADIDGTLLNDEYRLLPETVKNIQKVSQAGVMFASASARTLSYSRRGLGALAPLCCGFACVNGAYVVTAEGEAVVDTPLDREQTAFLIDLLDRHKTSIGLIGKDDAAARVRHPQAVPGFTLHHGSLRPLKRRLDLTPYLVAMVGKDLKPVVEQVARQLPDIQIAPIVSTHKPGCQGTLFQRKGTHKGAGLRHLAAHLGIPVSKTLALGDSYLLDGFLLAAAGRGVAMKNAHPQLIAQADDVTPKDNNHDGVGDYLAGLFEK